MRSLKVHSRYWQRQVKLRFAEWDGVFGLDPEEKFFDGWSGMPEFDFSDLSFSAAQAWWLAELCRTSYTPDQKELPRDRRGVLPHRENFLSERSPFVEELSIHKTGNHASIYRRADGAGGTILCFRGTARTRQWVMNLVIRPHGWKRFLEDGGVDGAHVHSGFYVLFKRIWPRLLPTLESLPRPWVFTGHSLGGALAVIAGAVAKPDLVCTFGSPKPGNEAFYRLMEPAEVWRFVNDTDIVPRLPLPDLKLQERILTHGWEARVLTENSGLSRFADADEEDRLPFPIRALAQEFQSPPSWLRNHRIGEYCEKLRKIALETT
jgi:hypothetical protein